MNQMRIKNQGMQTESCAMREDIEAAKSVGGKERQHWNLVQGKLGLKKTYQGTKSIFIKEIYPNVLEVPPIGACMIMKGVRKTRLKFFGKRIIPLLA